MTPHETSNAPSPAASPPSSSSYRNRQLSGIFAIDEPRTYEGLHLERCDLADISLSCTEPSKRSIVRDSTFVDCRVARSVGLAGALVDNVIIDGLRTIGTPFLNGTLLRHVTFRGRIGNLVVDQYWKPDAPSTTQLLRDAARAFYDDVDWAVDISTARFDASFELRSVPGNLVIGDPETQVLLRRSELLGLDLSRFDFGNTAWDLAILRMIDDEVESSVLVGPTTGPQAGRCRRLVRQLIDAGIAHPPIPRLGALA